MGNEDLIQQQRFDTVAALNYNMRLTTICFIVNACAYVFEYSHFQRT